MKRVLVFHYSQTGQLDSIVKSVCKSLVDSTEIDVFFEEIKPQPKFPFPWSIGQFFSIFPEAVLMDSCVNQPLSLSAEMIDAEDSFDLIILAYQVWFLSPSLPVTALLKSEEAVKIFNNKPVVTLIGCRNMWLMAQEKVKAELKRLNAQLVDNIALTDKGGMAWSFLSTPVWMFSGKKQPYRWIPEAGVDEVQIQKAERFGKAIASRLTGSDEKICSPMLKGLGAVQIQDKLIASEKIGHRSFVIWSRLLKSLGPQFSRRRYAGLLVYVVFLILMIITVVPVTTLLKKIFAPLMKSRIQQQKQYFAQPSGEL